MNNAVFGLATILVLLFGASSSPGQTVPQEARRHFDSGTAAVKAGDYETAVREFEDATGLAPDWPDAFFNLGLARMGAGRYAEAAKSFRQYSRLAPQANDAEGMSQAAEALGYFYSGVAAIKAADYEAAIKELAEAAKLAPEFSDAFYNLGLAQEGAKRYGEAAENYRQYLRLEPNSSDAEDIEDLIQRMEDMANPSLRIAEGYLGIPWGASREQIVEFMNGQGYQQRSGASSDTLTFEADFEGTPCDVVFLTKADSFYEVTAVAVARSNYPWETTKTVDRIRAELSNEYGPRQERKTWAEEFNEGLSVPHVQEIWNLVDSRTQDKYTIKIDFHGTYFADMEGLVYVVDVTNTADSLYERLSKKDPDINAKSR